MGGRGQDRLAHPLAVLEGDAVQHLLGGGDAAAAPPSMAPVMSDMNSSPEPSRHSQMPHRAASTATRKRSSEVGQRAGVAVGAQRLDHQQHGQDGGEDHRGEQHAGRNVGRIAHADRGEAGLDRQHDQRSQDGERGRAAPAQGAGCRPQSRASREA